MISFSEEGIGGFLKGSVEVTADSFARFAMTDAVCTPGLWSFKNVPTSGSVIEISSTGAITITAPAGTTIELGNNPVKMTCNNLPACIFSGAPHSGGNIQVKV
jgi:hypothetical protein